MSDSSKPARDHELLQDFLVRSAEQSGEKVALVCGDERLSFSDLAGRGRRVGRALRRHGVRPGDRVLLFGGNTTDQVLGFWGTLLAGAVAVPVDARTKADKLGWMLGHCRPAALIADHRLATTFVPALGGSAAPSAVFVSRLGQGCGLPRAVDLHLAMEAEHAVDEGDVSRPTTDALACIIYTSGSTGRPKGVMLTHRNMTSAAAAICRYLDLRADDVVHGTLPLAFDYGLYQMLLSFRQGARLVLAPPFALPAQVLKEAAREQVTFFPGVPTMFAMLGQLRDTAAWDLSAVRAVTNTAAALGERHIQTIRRVFPRARIFSMYGVTECKRCSYLPPEDLARKPGSVGIAIPGTELWLEDEGGRRLGLPHQVGRIVVRGPTVMLGYWEDPEATARVLRPGLDHTERVLVTGDLGRLDEDGYLTFVGRTDDIIKSRGEKVSPKEIEAVLAAVEGVRECAAVGAADPLAGEVAVAFVAPEDGTTLEASELLRVCRQHLEPTAVPASIAVLPTLPKNQNGKVDKLALREMAGALRPDGPS